MKKRRFHYRLGRPAELLNQRKIAQLTGLNPSTISHIMTGRRKVSIDTAEKLEVTGVPRECWAWPDRWHNPYIPLVPEGTAPDFIEKGFSLREG
jgi:transcriptional regulator with XRE-family HTH domain